MKLYELTGEFLALQSKLEDEEHPDIEAELASVKMKFDEKVENCAKMILTFKREQKAIEAEISRLRKRKNMLKHNEEQLKKYTQHQMEKTGLKSVRTELFKVNIQRSPMSVSILDENAIEDDFVRSTPHVLKSKILRHVKDTGVIPDGVEVVTTNTHLRIY